MEIAFPKDGGQIALDIHVKNPYNESELVHTQMGSRVNFRIGRRLMRKCRVYAPNRIAITTLRVI